MSRTPAPIDPSGLAAALRPFGESRLLPAEAYTSREILEWERRHLFEGAWVCLGTEAHLAEPGDQKAVRIGADGILLVRGDDGALRGFYNTCRHRAHELLQAGECRRARAIRCPYHGWSYGLDGALSPSVLKSHVPGFDATREGLVPAPIGLWRGWVFANASGDAPPLSDWIGGLEELARPYEPERLRRGGHHAYDVAANWKLLVENYHECYHCPQIHPELCRVSPPDSGDNREGQGAWIGGSMDLVPEAATMSLDGTSRGLVIRGVEGERRRQVLYFGLLPNILLSFHPDYVMTHRLEPLEPGRTRIECEWLFPPEAFETPGFDPDYAVGFWDITNRQDWHAVESVQRGVASRGYRPGTLTPREDALYAFVTRIARAYLDGAVPLQPALTAAPGRA
jgi:Rieske 2Fe-2S family protein